MATRVVAILAAVVVTGCSPRASSFMCTDDASCGAGGKCEPNFNLCSFPNEAQCGPGGRSFGDLGGPASGQCVGSVPLPDAGPLDVPPDARLCFGTGIVHVCLASPPMMAFVVSAPTTIDTTNSPMCAMVTSGGDYCFVAATDIILNTGGSLRATGSRPLVLLSTNSITSATGAGIDVGSHRMRVIGTPETGAGADPTDPLQCAAGTLPTAAGGGGGAGGSFTGLAGNGGNGNNTANTGGTPGAVAGTVNTLRGGCPGQTGDGNGTDPGARGHGGGAVFLIALNKIQIGGGIIAGGEGGAGAIQNKAGGGGGGAGGMIGFDAPTIMVTSVLVANGGGGGEGANLNSGGKDGSDAVAVMAAPGGSGLAANGGNGGDGSSGDPAGAGVSGLTGTDGGGGGGGGAGLIKAPATASLGTNVSPLPTP